MVTKLEQHYIDKNIKYGFITYKNPKYNSINYRTEPYFIKQAVPQHVVVKQNLEKQYRRILTSRVINKFNNLGKQTDTLLEMFVLLDKQSNIAKRIVYSTMLDFQIEQTVHVTYNVTVKRNETLLDQQIFKINNKYASWSTAEQLSQKTTNSELVKRVVLKNDFHLIKELTDIYKEHLTTASISSLVTVTQLINRGIVTSVTVPVVTKAHQTKQLTLKVHSITSKVEVTVN